MQHGLADRPLEGEQPLSLIDPQPQTGHFDELTSDAVEYVSGWAHGVSPQPQIATPVPPAGGTPGSRFQACFCGFSRVCACPQAAYSDNHVDTCQRGHKHVGLHLERPAARVLAGDGNVGRGCVVSTNVGSVQNDSFHDIPGAHGRPADRKARDHRTVGRPEASKRARSERMARRTNAAVGVVCPRCGMLAARIIGRSESLPVIYLQCEDCGRTSVAPSGEQA